MSKGETIASAYAKAFIGAVLRTNKNRERSEMLSALASRGSRPPGLNDGDVVRVWRNERRLGDFKASQFNWDLWCNYIVLPAQPNDEGEGK